MTEASSKLLAVDAMLADMLRAKAGTQFDRLKDFKPYEKQLEFYHQGVNHKERMLNAGNQVGKSEGGGFEMACHLTGEYPEWWPGRRWNRPIRAWACGESAVAVRDIQQKKLLGPPGVEAERGTGLVPLRLLVDASTSRGATDAVDTLQVRHRSGGVSTCTFKSYEQGRKKFQGEPIDLIWADEECPEDIYTECLARLTATRGMIYVTFTPLQGKTWLVSRFFDEDDPTRAKVTMAMQDAGHIHPEDIPGLLAQYPAHERDARMSGTPMMGSGRIFPYPIEMLSEPQLSYIPEHWGKVWGVDFGIGHPFAAVLALYDRDNDVLHIHDCFKMVDAMPDRHAQRMKLLGAAVPVAWPQDGTAREKSGEVVSSLYSKQGLPMAAEWATFPEGGYGTEAGVLEICQRIETGRFKVAAHLSEWWAEYADYHRKDGLIVKIRDDLMSATRMCIMMKRIAKAVPLGSVGGKPYHPNNGPDGVQMARGLDFDVFTGA